MRARVAAMTFPGVAAAAFGGLVVQVRRAAHASFPEFPDLDPSGTYGPPGQPVRVALLGDSTLTGPGLDDPGDIWMAQIARRLRHAVSLEMHAVGGSRARDVLTHQVPRVLDSAPDLAVVSVGANDAIHGTSRRDFVRDLRGLAGALVGRVPEVVVLGVGDLGTVPRVPRALKPVVRLRAWQFDRSHARVAAAVPGVTRIAPEGSGNAEFRRRGRELFAADLFHPNREGHRVWAESFGPYVAGAIARAHARNQARTFSPSSSIA